jgi:hypothetical protein
MINQSFTAPYPPYFDNFKVDDNVHKVLFRAGSNFNHRHLNQLQSILQEQLSTFGSHFFKNGSFVSGGAFSRVDSSIILNIEDISSSLSLETLKDQLFFEEFTGKKVKIKFAEEITTFTNSKNALVISSEDSEFTFPPLGMTRLLQGSSYIDVSLSSATSVISFEEGIIFLNGYFINFPSQSTIIPSSAASIGFELQESLVDFSSDSSLLDNAIGYASENSEGADRLKIILRLKSYPIIEDSNFYDIIQRDNFFEYIRIKNNIIIKDVSRPIYNEFEKTLARRTYDESGSYTVNPFLLNVKEGDSKSFELELSPGKAYIFGYEFDSIAKRTLELPKSSGDIVSSTTQKTFQDFSFVKTSSLLKYLDTQNQEGVTFRDTSNKIIGTAKCFYITKSAPTDYKLYFNEITFGVGYSAEDVSKVKNIAEDDVAFVDDFILNPEVDSFLITLPFNIKDLNKVSVLGQKSYSSVSGNSIIVGEGETFPSSLESYHGFDSSKNPVIITSKTITSTAVSFVSSSPIAFLLVENISLLETPLKYSIGEKNVTIPFTKSFIIKDKIIKVKEILFNSQNILSDFNSEEVSSHTFIEGTKFTYHGTETLLGNINVVYEMAYGFSGHFSTLSLSQIDLRKSNYFSPPSILPSSPLGFTFSSSLPRFDKLVLTLQKTFELISGTPSEHPIPPKDRLDAMTLYTLYIPPDVKLPSSIGIKFHENKRYTMRDIGKLEKRIENLEYYTALNLLETETKDQNFTDQNGDARFKNGFLVDNFKSYKSVSLDSKDSIFSLDTKNGELRPSFDMSTLDALYNQEKSSTISTGDLITLPFSEVSFIEQTDASSTINLNPFEVFVWEGKLTLTPETDFWTDTETRPSVNLNNFGENDVYQELGAKGFNSQWGSWETQILSVPETESKNSKEVVSFNDIDAKIEKRLWNPSVDPNIDQGTLDAYSLWVGSGFTRGFSQTSPDGYVNGQPAILLSFKGKKEVSTQNTTTFQESQIKTSSLGSSVVDIALTPYLRARELRFDVVGLKPSTSFFALFSEVDVTKLCAMIGSESNLGTLTTNEFGELSGIFNLPPKQFKNGTHSFKLVDTLAVNSSQISSFAVSQYFAKGLTQTKQETFISTREPVVTSQQFTFEKVTAAFDTSVLKKTYKLSLTLEGEGLCEVSDWQGVKLLGKSNQTVSYLFDENTDLKFKISESTQKYSSQEGLPFVNQGDGKKNFVSTLSLTKDTSIILRFDVLKSLKVKVSLKNNSEGFKERPYPYYKVSFDTFRSGVFDTTLQFKKSLIDPTLITPTPTPTQTPTATLSPTPSGTPVGTPTPSPTGSGANYSGNTTFQKSYYGNNNNEELFCGTIGQGWYNYGGPDVPTTLKGAGGPGLHFRNVFDDMASIAFTTDDVGRPWVRFKVGTSPSSYNVIQFAPYNPIATPTPTPTISVTPSLSPTPSETPTPTPTQTETPSPTPTPYITATPSSTLVNYAQLPFDQSVISDEIMETKEIELNEGDSITAEFFNLGSTVTNYSIKESSNIGGVAWDAISDEESSLTITSDLIAKVGTSTLNLIVTPVDDFRVNIYGRSSGNILRFKYLLSKDVTSPITYSGDLIIPGTTSWIQAPSLFDIPGNECSFLRLVPLDETTRTTSKKSVEITFRKDALEPHPQSPLKIIDEVFSGKESDYVGNTNGLFIKFLSAYEGPEIPFFKRGNQWIKELYLDFKSEVIIPPEPEVDPLLGQPTSGDKVLFAIYISEIDIYNKKKFTSDFTINNVSFSDLLKNPSSLGYPAKLVANGMVFEVFVGTKFILSSPYVHETPSQIFTKISTSFIASIASLIDSKTSGTNEFGRLYESKTNIYFEDSSKEPSLYIKNTTIGLSDKEKGTLLSEYLYTDKQVIPSERKTSVITCSKHRVLGLEKTYKVDKTTFVSQSMSRFTGETTKLEIDFIQGTSLNDLFINNIKYKELTGGLLNIPHKFTSLTTTSFLLEVPKNTELSFSYASSLTALTKLYVSGVGFPSKLDLKNYVRDFLPEEKGTLFNDVTNPISERKTKIVLSKDRFIKIQAANMAASEIKYLPPSSSGQDLSSSKICFIDPLAQSFFVDDKIYPEGIFLSSIDIFFKTKDPVVPVTLELRPSVNSYPSSKEIIPFSRVSKSPRDISVSEDASAPTNFKFPSPVYLLPGEYNFVVVSDSILYDTWVARLGEFKIGSTTEERITKNPYSGVLFKSSNNVAWIPESDVDFTFRINRCSFKTLSPFTAILENSPFSSKGTTSETPSLFTTLRTNGVTILPEKTSFSNSSVTLLSTSKKKNTLTSGLNESRELDQVYMIRDSSFDSSKEASITNSLSFFSSKDTVSPVLDKQRLSYVLVNNIINKLEEKELETELKPFGGKGKARYLTKEIKLNLEIPANKIHISFAGSIPKGCQIRTYYKILNRVFDKSELSILDKSWILLGTSSKTASTKETFIDFELETPDNLPYEGNSDINDFDVFMVKLLLESDNPAFIPRVKDFRTIALSA